MPILQRALARGTPAIPALHTSVLPARLHAQQALVAPRTTALTSGILGFLETATEREPETTHCRGRVGVSSLVELAGPE